MKWVSKIVSGVGGVRAICEEQQKKKGIYPFHKKYLLRHNTFFFDVACLTRLLKGKYYNKINCCLLSSSINKMDFILTKALLP